MLTRREACAEEKGEGAQKEARRLLLGMEGEVLLGFCAPGQGLAGRPVTAVSGGDETSP